MWSTPLSKHLFQRTMWDASHLRSVYQWGGLLLTLLTLQMGRNHSKVYVAKETFQPSDLPDGKPNMYLSIEVMAETELE